MDIINHQGEYFYMKLIPNFLKMRSIKKITQLEIDETRNILYSLSHTDSNDMTEG